MPPTVELPESVAEAVGALRDGGLVIAGGTEVMPRLNTQAHDVETLVSLRQAGLVGIAISEGIVEVGAATTLAQIGEDERLALLHPVVESIASPSIRNLATVGGNLFVEQPYGDFAVCLLALEADLQVAGSQSSRSVSVADFFEGGIEPQELVVSVRFPMPNAGEWFYTKAMRRRLNSGSIITVAAVVSLSDGTVASARLALGGVGRTPVRAGAAEAALVGRTFDRENVEAAAAAAVGDAEPFSDAYASAWYRKRVLPVHVRRALLGD
jgi:CO/xanthine dehydrogenase FAD-binding subunit